MDIRREDPGVDRGIIDDSTWQESAWVSKYKDFLSERSFMCVN